MTRRVHVTDGQSFFSEEKREATRDEPALAAAVVRYRRKETLWKSA
jgi:hypothetical protein